MGPTCFTVDYWPTEETLCNRSRSTTHSKGVQVARHRQQFSGNDLLSEKKTSEVSSRTAQHICLLLHGFMLFNFEKNLPCWEQNSKLPNTQSTNVSLTCFFHQNHTDGHRETQICLYFRENVYDVRHWYQHTISNTCRNCWCGNYSLFKHRECLLWMPVIFSKPWMITQSLFRLKTPQVSVKHSVFTSVWLSCVWKTRWGTQQPPCSCATESARLSGAAATHRIAAAGASWQQAPAGNTQRSSNLSSKWTIHQLCRRNRQKSHHMNHVSARSSEQGKEGWEIDKQNKWRQWWQEPASLSPSVFFVRCEVPWFERRITFVSLFYSAECHSLICRSEQRWWKPEGPFP